MARDGSLSRYSNEVWQGSNYVEEVCEKRENFLISWWFKLGIQSGQSSDFGKRGFVIVKQDYFYDSCGGSKQRSDNE